MDKIENVTFEEFMEELIKASMQIKDKFDKLSPKNKRKVKQELRSNSTFILFTFIAEILND